MSIDFPKGAFDRMQRETKSSDKGVTNKATSGDEVDWLAFWERFNCPINGTLIERMMSMTQLEAAIKVSDQVSGSHQVLLGQAEDAGLLSPVKRNTREKGDGVHIITVGYELSEEVRDGSL